MIDDIGYGMCDDHINSQQFQIGVTAIIKMETGQSYSFEQFYTGEAA